MGPEALIISMRGQPARRVQVDRIRGMCPFPSSVIDAVDGRMLDEAERGRAFRRLLHRPAYPFAPQSGEIGCFLSHRAAWQAILDRRMESGVILEDDVELEPTAFGRAVALAVAAARDHGLVRLPLMERTPPRRRRAAFPCVTTPVVLPLGTQAQVVSADAARRLLDASRQFDRPIDVFLQMRWVTGVDGCVVSPSGVFDAVSLVGGSTIHASPRRVRDLIRREVGRPLYRFSVRARCVARWAAGGPHRRG